MMARVFKLIEDEIIDAEMKHPTWPAHDPVHAAAIVAEESGELVRAALQYTYEGGSCQAMRTEALHTAATAVRFLMYLEDRRPADRRT